MLRPWVPLIALALLMALTWRAGTGFLALLGGCLLGLALASELLARLAPALGRAQADLKRKRTRERAARLDWSVIDNSMSSDRLKPDCERPATLGVCTGRECMVYKTCNFNIKKPLP
jgi:hypothetical protein